MAANNVGSQQGAGEMETKTNRILFEEMYQATAKKWASDALSRL